MERTRRYVIEEINLGNTGIGKGFEGDDNARDYRN